MKLWVLNMELTRNGVRWVGTAVRPCDCDLISMSRALEYQSQAVSHGLDLHAGCDLGSVGISMAVLDLDGKALTACLKVMDWCDNFDNPLYQWSIGRPIVANGKGEIIG